MEQLSNALPPKSIVDFLSLGGTWLTSNRAEDAQNHSVVLIAFGKSSSETIDGFSVVLSLWGIRHRSCYRLDHESVVSKLGDLSVWHIKVLLV